ncbi:MAG TPA: UvrD-helicase domain-containing protein [Geobacteraceae bacterium]|nr:UvrD-helicase domain-containing protein [Geobacteraceae bacterium]
MKWSEAKRKVFEFDRNIVVSAGAGSGKTAALVELYLRLLAGETSLNRSVAVDEIVAITFTEKAAAEMKERVREGAKKRAGQGESASTWEQVLRSLPSASISTFHSFCSRILRENPVEAGIDPSFTVLDELASKTELAAAADEVIEAELKVRSREILLLLEQFPLTGAGPGKGLREHLIDLHNERSSTGCELAAIQKMSEDWMTVAEKHFAENVDTLRSHMVRVRNILNGKELVFHKKLRDLPELWEKHYLSTDSHDAPEILAAMRDCIAGNWGKDKPFRDNLTECLDTLDLALHQVRCGPTVEALLSLLEKLEHNYQRRKANRSVLDFEDLQTGARDLLRRDARLREEYRGRFAVVMVDEFQDTNRLQKELVELLCGPRQRLFVVGDPKQSIYMFRGADVTVFVHSQREVAEGGGHSLFFQESFRSREGIINLVNELFKGVMTGGGGDFNVRYDSGDILTSERRDWDGTPCVELLSVEGEGNSPVKRRTEAAAVSRMIRRMVSGEAGVQVYDRRDMTDENVEPVISYFPRKPRWGDIAILFRRFSNLKLFERELRRAGIPYYVVKGKGFYRCQEILDLLNFLKYLEFGGDIAALAAVLRSPLCGISDETLYLMGRREKGLAGWKDFFNLQPGSGDESMRQGIEEADRARLENLRRLILRLRPLKDCLSPAELLEEIITGADFSSILLTTFQGGQKVANLRKLIEISRSLAEYRSGALRNFINYLERLSEEEPTEAEAVISVEGGDVVRLMTVHQSKGLEFPVVFVPEIGAGRRPDNSPVRYDETRGIGIKAQFVGNEARPTLAFEEIGRLRGLKEDAESQRLLYVALTRARDYLVVSGEGSGPWRSWIDSFVAGDHSMLIKVTNVDNLLEGEDGHGLLSLDAGSLPLEPGSISEAVRRSLHYAPAAPSVVVISPTALEDFAACPRKYFYKEILGLDEGLIAGLLGRNYGRHEKTRMTMGALEKGNLAHDMLENMNFTGNRTDMIASCRRTAGMLAVDPSSREVEEVIENVLALAETTLAGALECKKIRREYPFTLRVDGAATYYIKGAMDLVAEGDEEVTVYDYKYMKKKDADLEGYRFQVRTYMTALAAGHPGKRVRGKLLFLRDGGEETVDCDSAAFKNMIRKILDTIRSLNSEEDFVPVEGCMDTLCPFRHRCMPTDK